MRSFSGLGVVVSAPARALAAGCAAPDVNGSDLRRGGRTTDGDDKNGGETENGATPPGGAAPVTPATPSTPPTGDVDLGDDDDAPPPPIKDADKDGIADEVDCAPNDPLIAGTRLLDDPLATDQGFFTQADGFPASWAYNAGYVQNRLTTAPDQSIFTKDPQVSEAIVEVTAASTEIGNLANPNLRQMFITFGSGLVGGTFGAIGCGVEVDGAQAPNPTQKTSIVSMSGNAAGVTTAVLNRVNREPVQANELFTMRGTYRGGQLKCEVTVRGVTTTATSAVSARTGSIGFYTSQTKALFKSAKICKLK